MLDKDVIWFALTECASVSAKQLICVVCFAEAPGTLHSVDVIYDFIFFFGRTSFWYDDIS